jgi:membrane protein implicated in regulation of membrane protease activity
MNESGDQKSGKKNTINYLLIGLVGQVGCLTMVIVLAAVLGGLALDAKFGTKPWFTVGLLVVSIPVSLVVMFFVARKTTAKMKANQQDNQKDEEGTIGKNA